jgi:hypothetical protein
MVSELQNSTILLATPAKSRKAWASKSGLLPDFIFLNPELLFPWQPPYTSLPNGYFRYFIVSTTIAKYQSQMRINAGGRAKVNRGVFKSEQTAFLAVAYHTEDEAKRLSYGPVLQLQP